MHCYHCLLFNQFKYVHNEVSSLAYHMMLLLFQAEILRIFYDNSWMLLEDFEVISIKILSATIKKIKKIKLSSK